MPSKKFNLNINPCNRAFIDLRESVTDSDPPGVIQKKFEYFKTVLAEQHLIFGDRPIFKKILKYKGDVPKGKLHILEHGCGGGFIVFSLLSLGYVNSYGVDIGAKADGNMDLLNKMVSLCLGLPEKRFIKYDGVNLPFAEQSFDVVFSTGVLEHVDNKCIDGFYREGRRVLKDGGFRYDNFPHAWKPYDSHTRLWFIHYLPRPLCLKTYEVLGRDHKSFERYLFLRSPRFHFNKIRNLYVDCKNETMERVFDFNANAYYEGPKKLRVIIDKMLRNPIFKPLARLFISIWASVDSVAFVGTAPNSKHS